MTTADTEYIKSGGARVALTCLEKCVCAMSLCLKAITHPGGCSVQLPFCFIQLHKSMQTEGKSFVCMF